MFLAGALVLAAGCDPGWGYQVLDPQLGAMESSQERGAIGLRARGDLFTGMLTVDVEVTNDGPVPLVVREDTLRVLDAAGRPLPWYWGRRTSYPCENAKDTVVTLHRAQVCIMRGHFQVRPNAGIFGGRNTRLRTLTVVIEGQARGGGTMSRTATLEWE